MQHEEPIEELTRTKKPPAANSFVASCLTVASSLPGA